MEGAPEQPLSEAETISLREPLLAGARELIPHLKDATDVEDVVLAGIALLRQALGRSILLESMDGEVHHVLIWRYEQE